MRKSEHTGANEARRIEREPADEHGSPGASSGALPSPVSDLLDTISVADTVFAGSGDAAPPPLPPRLPAGSGEPSLPRPPARDSRARGTPGSERGQLDRHSYSFTDEPTSPLHSPAPEPPPDDLDELVGVPQDAYVMGPEIARGGMGRISMARDRRLGRPVAIKELCEHNPIIEARFEREVRITGRLQHPAIVPVYEAGRWPSGEPFYAMKLVAGESLDKVIAKTRTLRDRLALLPTFVAVADALAYAHSHCIIHRDLKPANVLIGEFGEIVVIDWGLAKDLRATPDSQAEDSQLLDSLSPPRLDRSELTLAGAALGTPAYMPLEQALGESVDQRADVYSLGAMLHHLLAGKTAYHTARSPREMIGQIIKGPPEPLAKLAPEVPPDLVAIVDKAMARDPAQRYPSARELAEDLKRFTTGKLVSAHAYSPGMLLRRWLERHRAVVQVAALMLVALIAIAAVGVWRIAQERNAAEAQRQVAQDAQARAEARNRALVLLNARAALEEDPTSTMAWLSELPPSPEQEGLVRLLAMQARARGVARHVLRGHAGKVYGLAFTPDGERLVTSATDGTVHLWDVGSGQILATDRAGSRRITAKLSPDGQWIAVAGDHGTVLLWNPYTGERRTLHGPAEPVHYLAFSPDGARLVSSAADRSVWLWQVDSGTGYQLATTAEAFVEVMFSPDGQLVALSADRPARLYQAATGQALPLPAGISPYWLAFSPDNRWIAAGDSEGDAAAVYLWERDSGTLRTLRGHSAPAQVLAFSPDSARIALATVTHEIWLWELASNQHRLLGAHDRKVTELVFSSDGQLLFSGGSDPEVRLWHVDSGAMHSLHGHEGRLSRLQLSPDGQLLASASHDGTVRLWPMRDGVHSLAGSHGKDQVLAFSPDGRFLAAGGTGGDVTLWQPRTGAHSRLPGSDEDIAEIVFAARSGADMAVRSDKGRVWLWRLATAPEDGDRGEPTSQLVGERARDGSVAISPQGDALAWVRGTSELALWQRQPGTTSGTPAAYGEIWDTAFSPDGQLLAYADGANLMILDRRTGDTRTLSGHQGVVSTLVFAPGGMHLASGGADGEVRLWQLASGTSRVLARHTDQVLRLDFSPDGARVASAGLRGDIWLAQVDGDQARALVGHYFRTKGVAFSPDGRLIASSCIDGTVRLWDSATGVGRLWSSAQIGAAAFSPDGRYFAATSGGGVQIWPIEAPSEPVALRAWIRELTSERPDQGDRDTHSELR